MRYIVSMIAGVLLLGFAANASADTMCRSWRQTSPYGEAWGCSRLVPVPRPISPPIMDESWRPRPLPIIHPAPRPFPIRSYLRYR
jgi:hypothetical protein